MKTALLFDQGMISRADHFSPFALTDVLTTYAGEKDQPMIHFWQLSQTLILGMKDSRVPYLNQGLQAIQAADYYPLLRNAGGLGVVSDAGILNVSLILPKQSINPLSIDDGYQTMLDWLNRTSFGKATITAGEVADSYCPGKFDLSINGKKIAGIAQRRVKEGVAIMMYLSVSGDQKYRGELVRSFYQAGLEEAFGTLGYPAVNPDSMTTLSDVFEKELSIAEVKEQLLQGIDFTDETTRLPEFYQTEEYQQRLKNMYQRNTGIQEELHDKL
ncbi:lipoate--protein ligase family protein [Enterococcus sp. 669A]|uniref:Lipoate--protein ligase family protein n=1 Tax=Candidatus Enterococcus moelleringii TaxID=2815325 RepID=A0ABS3LFR5_9ENTE|nr:lipoate--protein ligase family protein [Enterococcus sp. 669A]MBO1308487.1 lipoate--protein ligase family protein [Enterococcus sp. 669A]